MAKITREHLEPAALAAGHTAGPWSVDECWVESDDGRITACVHGNAADGELIAAAPDLLAEVIRLRAEVAALKGGAA